LKTIGLFTSCQAEAERRFRKMQRRLASLTLKFKLMNSHYNIIQEIT
jgi:hypothetical protein